MVATTNLASKTVERAAIGGRPAPGPRHATAPRGSHVTTPMGNGAGRAHDPAIGRPRQLLSAALKRPWPRYRVRPRAPRRNLELVARQRNVAARLQHSTAARGQGPQQLEELRQPPEPPSLAMDGGQHSSATDAGWCPSGRRRTGARHRFHPRTNGPIDSIRSRRGDQRESASNPSSAAVGDGQRVSIT